MTNAEAKKIPCYAEIMKYLRGPVWLLGLFLIIGGGFSVSAQAVQPEPILIDPHDPVIVRAAAGAIEDRPDGSRVFHFRVEKGKGSDLRSSELALERLRGRKLLVKATLRADRIGAKPQSWNGVKIMLKIEAASGTTWPQLAVPVGSWDWQAFSGWFFVPADAIKVTLILGLEQVTGEVRMRDIRLAPQPLEPEVPAALPSQPIFTGHGPIGLRGAMISPQTMQRTDFDVLTKEWGANLVRWQLVRSSRDAKDPVSYQAWLEKSLHGLDQGLVWAAENGVKVVVDLHSPPGGGDSPGGYQDASGGLFASSVAQAQFVAVWQKIAARYRGNPVIWGFDLVNEPIDTGTAEGCLDWNGLATQAALAIRQIDPDRTLIVEPAEVGSAAGFRQLRPLALDGVVYSFHMYQPHEFTHQGVFQPSQPVSYPGLIAGANWDRATLKQAMAPAIEFAARYRVQLYVGEFGAIRWAPGADRYLADLVSIFEEMGWDWSFHAFREWQGWSPEYGSNQHDQKPVLGETARMQLFKSAFLKNRVK